MKLALPLGILALLAAPALAAGAAADAAQQVTILDNTYNPDLLVAHVGDTIHWTNLGARPHTVNVLGGPGSGVIEPGNDFSMTLTSAGVIPYYCAIHQLLNMHATIVVLP
jgi:plastocyanin